MAALRSQLGSGNLGGSGGDGSRCNGGGRIAVLKSPPGFIYDLTKVNGDPVEPWLIPMRVLYFPIVTLTTLGFGDYTPASIPAQIVVMSDVVLGYVMLGGLISIFANKLARRS